MTTDTVDTDIFYTLAWDDPYPAYRRLRERAPVRWLDGSTVLVTGFEACLAVVREPRASNDLRRDRADAGGRISGSGSLDRFDSFLYRDPPDHTRIRRVVLAALRQHPAEASGEVAARAAAALLDAVPAGQAMDAVSQLAQRLPAAVCASMFGLPAPDVPAVARWAREITVGLEPRMAPGQVRQRVLALYGFADYLTAHIERHRTDPADDLLSSLIRAGRADGDLVGDELVATTMLFLAALFGSTVDMVGNLVAVMARNPEQYQLVRQRPELVPDAVDELFRYESPFQLIYRIATADLNLAGVAVPAGTRIALLLGAANRDPARFADPDSYQVQRPENRHIAFGSGLHNCVGIPYSRIWARTVLNSLIERAAAIVPAGPFPARPARAFRGYASVPVRCRPARG